MPQYSNSEKSQARAMIFGVMLVIISLAATYSGLKHHDKLTAISGLVLGGVAFLGLYSATH